MKQIHRALPLIRGGPRRLHRASFGAHRRLYDKLPPDGPQRVTPNDTTQFAAPETHGGELLGDNAGPIRFAKLRFVLTPDRVHRPLGGAERFLVHPVRAFFGGDTGHRVMHDRIVRTTVTQHLSQRRFVVGEQTIA